MILLLLNLNDVIDFLDHEEHKGNTMTTKKPLVTFVIHLCSL